MVRGAAHAPTIQSSSHAPKTGRCTSFGVLSNHGFTIAVINAPCSCRVQNPVHDRFNFLLTDVRFGRRRQVEANCCMTIVPSLQHSTQVRVSAPKRDGLSSEPGVAALDPVERAGTYVNASAGLFLAHSVPASAMAASGHHFSPYASGLSI